MRSRTRAASARGCGRAGSGAAARPRPTRREARELREALRDLMFANNGGDADVETAAAALDGASRALGLGVGFETGAIRLVAPAAGIGTVLAAAGEAMADGSWQRLKACRSDSCRWAFVDHARNRSRQWCSMSVCGNRAKARRFRSRRGAASA